MLEAKVKYIVGQGILKKYEYRRRGEYIDYAKWIDKGSRKGLRRLQELETALRGVDKWLVKTDNE